MNLRVCIPGTDIMVDGFRVVGKNHYILSHFHSDHFEGLGKTWNRGKIYCTQTTANLIKSKIQLRKKNWRLIKIIEFDKPVYINHTKMTFFRANHCPGAAVVLFKTEDGKYHLHTGDFRFAGSNFPEGHKLRRVPLENVYLDTTYCQPSMVYPPQVDVVKLVCKIARRFEKKGRYLFLSGSYTIGKEKIVTALSKVFSRKIYVDARKYAVLKNVTSLDISMFTTKVAKTNIRLVSMGQIYWKKILEMENAVKEEKGGGYDGIVAFRPTCQPFPRTKAHKIGKTNFIIDVPYSEHSSFEELRMFLAMVKCRNIVPTVYQSNAEKQNMVVELRKGGFRGIRKKDPLKIPNRIIEFTRVNKNPITNYFFKQHKSFEILGEEEEEEENVVVEEFVDEEEKVRSGFGEDKKTLNENSSSSGSQTTPFVKQTTFVPIQNEEEETPRKVGVPKINGSETNAFVRMKKSMLIQTKRKKKKKKRRKVIPKKKKKKKLVIPKVFLKPKKATPSVPNSSSMGVSSFPDEITPEFRKSIPDDNKFPEKKLDFSEEEETFGKKKKKKKKKKRKRKNDQLSKKRRKKKRKKKKDTDDRGQKNLHQFFINVIK